MRFRKLVIVGVLIGGVAAAPVAADEEIVWWTDDDHSPYIEVSWGNPTEGVYLDYDQKELFSYDSSTGMLVFDSFWGGGSTQTPEQAGECTYVGDWTSANGTFTYGTCLSLRSLGDADRTLVWRYDSRNLTENTKEAIIGYRFLDADGNELETGGGLYAKVHITCRSKIVATTRPIQTCEIQPMAAALTDEEIDGVAPEASTYCVVGLLNEWKNLQPTLVHRVNGACWRV